MQAFLDWLVGTRMSPGGVGCLNMFDHITDLGGRGPGATLHLRLDVQDEQRVVQRRAQQCPPPASLACTVRGAASKEHVQRAQAALQHRLPSALAEHGTCSHACDWTRCAPRHLALTRACAVCI
jgi:hypothetical protein